MTEKFPKLTLTTTTGTTWNHVHWNFHASWWSQLDFPFLSFNFTLVRHFNFYLLLDILRDFFFLLGFFFPYLQSYQGINTKAHRFCPLIQEFSHRHPQFVLFIYIFDSLIFFPLCCHPASTMLSKQWWIITQVSVSLILPLCLVFGSFQSAL